MRGETGFKVEMGLEYKIVFTDTKKANNYFIEESGWRECFFDFDDLQDLAEHISFAFHKTPLYCIFGGDGPRVEVEGFMPFIRKTYDSFESSYEDYGSIIIVVEQELDAEMSYEY